MSYRGTILSAVVVLTALSFAAAQESVWKDRFAGFARACGVDTSSKTRLFHKGFDLTASNWPEICDPDAVEREGAWDDVEVWPSKAQAKLVSIVRTSQSGDWSFANYYCFRPDGSLNSVLSVYATSNADLAFDYVRRLGFDEAGRLRQNSTQFYRMGTTEVIARPTELDAIHDFAQTVPVYKNVAELPIAKELKLQSRCGARQR